ncbi:MAG: hypothetical protein WC520_01275 [Candidatus Paceibacterota bacterium]
MSSAPLSIYLLLPSSAFILLISLILFFRKKRRATAIFLLAGLLQFFWALGTFFIWESYTFGLNPKAEIISKIFTLAVFLIPVFLYHFSIEFCAIRNQKLPLFISYLISFVFIAVNDAQSIVNTVFFFKFNVLAFQKENLVYYAFAFFIFVMLFLILYNFSRAWANKDSKEENKKDLFLFMLLTLAILGFVLVFFLPEQGISVYPLFYITIPIYVLILGYIAIEKNPFASIITTDILVAIVLTSLASLIIFPELEPDIIGKSIIFVLIAFLCFILLRYTEKISNQKTECERLVRQRTRELEENTEKLEETKKTLEKSNIALEIAVKNRTKELEQMNNNLEVEVQERTKELKKRGQELEEKIDELQQFSDIFINRENKMVELKNKIRELEEKKNNFPKKS